MADDDVGLTRQWRNLNTGRRFLAAAKPNGDAYYADLDENDKPINAGNQYPKEEINKMLDESEMEADYNTVNFTFFDGKFIERKRSQRL